MSEPPREAPEEIQVLAGEYVLGALDAAEMRAVRQRAGVDAALADAILAWERRLGPLVDVVAPVAPPWNLWARIEAATAPAPERPNAVRTPPGPVERLTAALPQARPRPRRVWPWQAATAASVALAAGIAAFTVMAPPPAQPPAAGGLRVAVLLPSDTASAGSVGDPTPMMQQSAFSEHTGGAGFLVQARPDGAVVVSALGPVHVPAGRELELWVLPKGGKILVSLGTLPVSGRQMTLPVPPEPGTQMMISLEPLGGSPTGTPTGQVLYSGAFAPRAL
jgi:anti-sigma-K factor RskA